MNKLPKLSFLNRGCFFAFSQLSLPFFGAALLAPWSAAFAETLDDHYHRINAFGGLSGLCRNYPKIEECLSAAGDWSPDRLERVKSRAPFCVDFCPLDQYSFVLSSTGGREYPIVRTKDFDGGSASRGVEVSLFPVALELYKYEGCVGCSHIKTFPNSLEARLPGQGSTWLRLPAIGRGVFYLSKDFRRLAGSARAQGEPLELRIGVNNLFETRRISKKAVSEYVLMLEELGYSSPLSK